LVVVFGDNIYIVELAYTFVTGVQVGDSVIGLEGNDLTHFDDFFNFIEAIGRPITIRLSSLIINNSDVLYLLLYLLILVSYDAKRPLH
jgi:hypothetical protein